MRKLKSLLIQFVFDSNANGRLAGPYIRHTTAVQFLGEDWGGDPPP